MTEIKTNQKIEKILAKEIKQGIKAYKPQLRKFPLDNAIRYVLTEEEQEAFDKRFSDTTLFTIGDSL